MKVRKQERDISLAACLPLLALTRGACIHLVPNSPGEKVCFFSKLSQAISKKVGVAEGKRLALAAPSSISITVAAVQLPVTVTFSVSETAELIAVLKRAEIFPVLIPCLGVILFTMLIFISAALGSKKALLHGCRAKP